MFSKIQSFLKHFSSETIFVERELNSPSIQPRYDVILMHEGAKASSLDHTSINLNKRHYRGSPTKFEIHIPQTLDTIQQDRSNDPLQRSVKRDADTVELITRDIISGSYRGSAFRS